MVEPPEHDQGRHDQRARGIAEPPRDPDRAQVAPLREAAPHERGRADRSAHRRSQDPRERRELEDGARLIEDPQAAGEAPDEMGAEKSLEGVSHGDSQGRGRSARRGDVDEERPEQHGRPDAGAQEEKRRERDPRRGPDGRRAGVHRGEPEPDLSRDHIGRGDEEIREDVLPARAGNLHDGSVLVPG